MREKKLKKLRKFGKLVVMSSNIGNIALLGMNTTDVQRSW
jgi:uncharacterized protein YlbG (UPF0298 family)